MNLFLLVIDMQEVTVGKQHADYFHYDPELTERVNSVIRKYDAEHVIYIVNLMKKNMINRFAPFHAYKGTKEAELAGALLRVNSLTVEKYRGDAFSNPRLEELLREKGADGVELVGVDGGGCVAQTALGAVKRGYRTVINTLAVGTAFGKQEEKYRAMLQKKGALYQ